MTALLAILAAAAVPGALAPAVDYCVSGEAPAGAKATKVAATSPALQELVRNFLSMPPRFDVAKVTLTRFDGGDGGVAWAVATDRGECELMLTGSPDPLGERDRVLAGLGEKTDSAMLDRRRPFWTHAFLAKAASGKQAFAQLRGTGPGTNPAEIQIDASFMPMAGRD